MHFFSPPICLKCYSMGVNWYNNRLVPSYNVLIWRLPWDLSPSHGFNSQGSTIGPTWKPPNTYSLLVFVWCLSTAATSSAVHWNTSRMPGNLYDPPHPYCIIPGIITTTPSFFSFDLVLHWFSSFGLKYSWWEKSIILNSLWGLEFNWPEQFMGLIILGFLLKLWIYLSHYSYPNFLLTYFFPILRWLGSRLPNFGVRVSRLALESCCRN